MFPLPSQGRRIFARGFGAEVGDREIRISCQARLRRGPRFLEVAELCQGGGKEEMGEREIRVGYSAKGRRRRWITECVGPPPRYAPPPCHGAQHQRRLTACPKSRSERETVARTPMTRAFRIARL